MQTSDFSHRRNHVRPQQGATGQVICRFYLVGTDKSGDRTDTLTVEIDRFAVVDRTAGTEKTQSCDGRACQPLSAGRAD